MTLAAWGRKAPPKKCAQTTVHLPSPSFHVKVHTIPGFIQEGLRPGAERFPNTPYALSLGLKNKFYLGGGASSPRDEILVVFRTGLLQQ